MDPIESIHVKKDSTFAMLLEAQRRNCSLYYFEQKNLMIRDGKAYGEARLLQVFPDENHYFSLSAPEIIPLSSLDVILMRKDPPFNLEYIYTTYILELAEKENVLIANKPQSLRDANEKLFTSWFAEYCPKTLVTREMHLLKNFLIEQQDIVCKPLHGMGGETVFRLKYPDINASVIFETLTHMNTQYIMAQKYIPEVVQGDKRILMINGEPIPYALARIPPEGELRGNLAKGAKGVAQKLTPRDYEICTAVGKTLREKGLIFVGLDVIGNFLTEINVTSPTCIRELDAQCNLNISQMLMDCIFSLRKS